uniref:Uncharacterized protein n=1 Tax=Neolamprologus brichardi TaxID=32507 RepID=A0A3Q4MDS6_NEOBR
LRGLSLCLFLFGGLCLCVVVMGVLIFQVVHQEFRLSHLKVRLVENSAQITRKEEGIVELKAKISELQKSLDDVNTKVETLKKKKAEIEKSSEDAGKGLTACLHLHILSFCSHLLLSFIVSDDHEAAKSQAQENIQSLKEEIFNRDKAVCAFLDTTKDEGR